MQISLRHGARTGNVNRVLSRIGAMFNWAVDKDRIPVSLSDGGHFDDGDVGEIAKLALTGLAHQPAEPAAGLEISLAWHKPVGQSRHWRYWI
jgi:hypothetical protein